MVDFSGCVIETTINSSRLADWLKNLASITGPLTSWDVSRTANALMKKLALLISGLAVCAHLCLRLCNMHYCKVCWCDPKVELSTRYSPSFPWKR